MHQLLLLRHAKSAWDDPSIGDHERPLNGRGRRAATAMGERMRALGLVPDMVLVSTARRTRETLERLEPWAETPLIEPMEALYLAPAERVLDLVREVAETVRVLLVIGHNPGLHELAWHLARLSQDGDAVRRLEKGFPTAALAEFAVTGPWRTLDRETARLLRFESPRTLDAGHG
jgi:phosphohistidine phosphatase